MTAELLQRIREPLHLNREESSGAIVAALEPSERHEAQWLGTLPPIYPEWLGDRSFCETHGVRFPYASGSMANGIASVELVLAMARAQMLGFLGTAGLLPDRVELLIARIQSELEGTGFSWGANLIHSPQEPETERKVVELYLRRGVNRVEASAFLDLSPNVVRYSATGLRRGPDGRIHRENHLLAKVSRLELAAFFMSPAPAEILSELLSAGLLSPEEAELAALVPVAEDITVEADSGGHTDNRPLTVLFPAIAALRDQLQGRHGYDRRVRVGAAGGLGTPTAVAAAFGMGAAYVMTGTVNQSSVEAAISAEAKQRLAQAGVADVIMAPAADMFEMGVKVQVLKRGTRFGPKGLKLYELYRAHDGLDDLTPESKAWLETEVLHDSIESVWEQTSAFFSERNPEELARAATDPKHKMALLFRWYLGKSSKWAIDGQGERRMDYQIWCGPAMGAFNQWVAGSFLEPVENRSVVQIALNLLEGAAVVTRAQQLRAHGVDVPYNAHAFAPRPLEAHA